MRKTIFYFGMAVVMSLVVSCRSQYAVTNVQRTRVLIDKRFDKPVADEVANFMKPFTAKVDEQMAPVVGQSAVYMPADRPESLLGNLMPDILIWAGKFYNEKPVFAVYNIGGMRASLPEGKITIGDVFAVAPFENYICFLTLSGDKVLELFGQIASRGGEGLSHGVRMSITNDRKLKEVTIDGKAVDPNAQYRVATLDYLSHGNDKMTAFLSGTDRVEPTGEKDLIRNLMMEYFKEKAANGEVVSSKLEGRVTVE